MAKTVVHWLLGLIALAGLTLVWQWSMQPVPRLVFLEVGQGDATYIRTTTGQDILIDGGPSRLVLERLNEELPLFDRTIEVIILSHPDADHLFGLVEVLQRYKVRQVVTTTLPATKPLHLEFERLLHEQNIEHLRVVGGDTITLNSTEVIQVLYPFNNTDLTNLETNDTSLTMEYQRIVNGVSTTVFFSGDMGETTEQVLVNAGVVGDVDILKVPHHGSKSSASTELLEQLQPEQCVVMVGRDNTYGHPTAEALERLSAYCSIRRTDQEGSVTILALD